ncbi:Long-chain-fatty-acid--AMP ligase FadD32, partial [Ananas comosus]
MSYENYDPCYPDQQVVDRYLPMWAGLPAFRSKPAFVWATDTPTGISSAQTTYSQLDASVRRIADGLLGSLRRGDAVLVLCSPGLLLVQLIFACQRAGLVAIPIVPPDARSFAPQKQGPPHFHLFRAISQTNPKAAVADARYISAVAACVSASAPDRLVAAVKQLRWLPVEQLAAASRRRVDRPSSTSNSNTRGYIGCGPDDAYLIQYTSGATAIPKPVVVTAGAAAHNVRAARRAYGLQPSSVIVSWLPQYHDCGLMFLLLTVVAGATCVLTSPQSFLQRPRIWLEMIAEFAATCTPVPSFALPLVLKRGRIGHGETPLSLWSLKNLILINEPIYKSAVDEFVAEFKPAGLNPSVISPSYGLAENCTFVSTSWHSSNGSTNTNNTSNWYEYLPSHKRLLPSARLSPASPPESSDAAEEEDITIMIVNENTCEPAEDGIEGEIWVSSASNASGYLGHPFLTREAFRGRLKGTAGRFFVRTGDRGVVLGQERYLYVLGRTTDVIELDNGRSSVHPHYIETAAYESCRDRLRGGCIAAFGLSTARELIRSVVVVVAELVDERRRGGGSVVSTVYRSVCEGIREGVMKQEGVEVGWVVLVESGSVPKTTSGKLRRWRAKEKLLSGEFEVVFEAKYDEKLMVFEHKVEEESE